MTLTNAALPAEPPGATADTTARERREAKYRRRRNTQAVLATVIVGVLLLGGGGFAWYVVSQTDDLTARNVAAKQLLAASDGKVTEQTTRVTLSAEIAEVDSLLAEPVLTRVLTGTGAAQESLESATGAVQTSMVEFARGEVDAARQSLETTEARAKKVYAATEGKGVDDAVRARLQDALNTTAALHDAADASLAGADLRELEQTALDLGSNRSVVSLATETLAMAQDAITCPAPDQVWDPDSGRVPNSALSPIPWAPGHFVRTDVLDGLVELNAAFREAFGQDLTINSSYRSYESQESLYDPSSPIAAPPGCSNHGLGLAVDIGGGVETFDTEPYNWLKANAEAYGWVHPAFAEPNGRVPEPWHWQSVLARENS